MATKGLALGPFSIVPSSSGIIIANNGHHLTVIFEESRISIHLTHEQARTTKEKYLDRIEIGLSQVEQVSIQLMEFFFSFLHKVQIEALRKSEYFLFQDKHRRIEQALKENSPVERRKIRPNLGKIGLALSEPSLFKGMAHPPKILYDKKIRQSGLIVAEPLSKKYGLKTLHLIYIEIEGYEGWYFYDPEEIVSMAQQVISVLPERYKEFGNLVAEKMDFEKALDRMVDEFSLKAGF